MFPSDSESILSSLSPPVGSIPVCRSVIIIVLDVESTKSRRYVSTRPTRDV